ncbi:unnamed protein product, partial [Prorocentrum cordatum]
MLPPRSRRRCRRCTSSSANASGCRRPWMPSSTTGRCRCACRPRPRGLRLGLRDSRGRGHCGGHVGAGGGDEPRARATRTWSGSTCSRRGRGPQAACRAPGGVHMERGRREQETCGRAGLTPEILWEWTCRDALWALVLAKGVLSARVGSSPLLAMPEDLPQLQSDALFAVLGLASPSVAFLGLAQCEGGQHTIALRNRQLMFHRSDLASAVVGCQLLQALLTTALREGGRCGPALAGFLAGLLQPDVAAVRGFTSE